MLLKECYEDFLEYKRKDGYTEHTLGEYRRFIDKVLLPCKISNKDIADLRKTDIVDIKQAAFPFGEYGPQRAVSTFRQVLAYLDDRGEKLGFNWMTIQLPQVPENEQDFMDEEEFDDFVKKLDTGDFYRLRDRALYETLWSTGLRIGEALALNRDCFVDGEVKIENEKGGDEAKIFFSDRCIYWLNEYMKRRHDNHEALFIVNHYNGPRREIRCRARQRLLAYRKEFGIAKKITHMAFRRSYVSELLNKGANIKETQHLARHKSERTTLHYYAKVQKQKLRGVHNRIFNNSTIPMPYLSVIESQKVACG